MASRNRDELWVSREVEDETVDKVCSSEGYVDAMYECSIFSTDWSGLEMCIWEEKNHIIQGISDGIG